MMKIGPVGIDLIKKNEGCRLTAYRDVVNVLTIGWGHTGPDVHEGMTITQARADQMLDDRLAREFGAAVNKAIGTTPTTQGQFDAMVSLSYNIGTGRPGGKGGFVNSSICSHHVAGEYAQAADAFLLYDKAAGRTLAGLTRRRQEERALYLSAGGPVPVKEPPVEDEVVTRHRVATMNLQEFLRDKGFYRDSIDGDFGSASRLALSLYLRSK